MKKGQKPPPDPVDLIPEKIISTLMKSTGLDREGVFAKMAEFQVELDKLKNGLLHKNQRGNKAKVTEKRKGS